MQLVVDFYDILTVSAYWPMAVSDHHSAQLSHFAIKP